MQQADKERPDDQHEQNQDEYGQRKRPGPADTGMQGPSGGTLRSVPGMPLPDGGEDMPFLPLPDGGEDMPILRPPDGGEDE